MKFKRTCCRTPSGSRWPAGFTLAEVLAALTFMAIVIPVAVEGIRIAGRAGQVAERKAEAARVAERMLNEAIVTGQADQSTLGGTVREGMREYRWELRNEPWEKDALRVITVRVRFLVQGQEHDVQLSTLWNSSTEDSSSSSGGSSQ
jgi:type II secretory pathway pseudopilin PulG